MGYSPWFCSILGYFHTFFKIYDFVTPSELAIFEQKAWAIAMVLIIFV